MFSEDYELLDMHQRFVSGQHFWPVVVDYMRHESNRLRIFYPIRAALVECFGARVVFFRFLYTLMGTFTAFFLYRFMRFLKYRFWEAVAFPLVLLNGTYLYVWWRMGIGENIGMLFLSAGLAVAAVADSAKKRAWLDVLFVAMIGCMSLCKESFMVIVPAILFLKIWVLKQTDGGTWAKSFKRQAGVVAALTGLVAFQLFWTLRFTGTTFGGYAGVEKFNWGHFASVCRDLAKESRAFAIGGLLILILISAVRAPRKYLGFLTESVPAFLFFGLFSVPILFLYQKTGIYYHYALPGVFGVWFLFFCLYQTFGKNWGWVRHAVCIGLLAAAFSVGTREAIPYGVLFRDESRACETLMTEISRGTKADDAILIVLDPVRNLEYSYAMDRYLDAFAKRKNRYLFPILRKQYTDFEKALLEYPPGPLGVYRNRMFNDLADPASIRAIVVFPYTEIWFLITSRSWFHPSEFKKIQAGNFILYCRL
jgi:hypothetical protein